MFLSNSCARANVSFSFFTLSKPGRTFCYKDLQSLEVLLAEGDDRHGFMKRLLSHQAVACKSEPCFSQNLPKLAQQASAGRSCVNSLMKLNEQSEFL